MPLPVQRMSSFSTDTVVLCISPAVFIVTLSALLPLNHSVGLISSVVSAGVALSPECLKYIVRPLHLRYRENFTASVCYRRDD